MRAVKEAKKKCWPETVWPDGKITQVKCGNKIYAVDSHEWFW